MGFASKVTETVTLKDGNTVVVRKLGQKARRDAMEERQRKGMAAAAAAGSAFADMQAKAIEANGGIEKLKELAAKTPLLKYDLDIVLRRGIVSWSLSAKPTEAEIDDLDADDVDAIATRIAALSEPPPEAVQKNA